MYQAVRNFRHDSSINKKIKGSLSFQTVVGTDEHTQQNNAERIECNLDRMAQAQLQAQQQLARSLEVGRAPSNMRTAAVETPVSAKVSMATSSRLSMAVCEHLVVYTPCPTAVNQDLIP